jgi:hypothetical protein
MNEATAAAGASDRLTPAEVQQARDFLQRAEASLAAATADLTERQWRFQPAVGQWSIADILEHCAMTQQSIAVGVRRRLAAAPPGPNPDARAVDEVLLTQGEDRSRKAEAPEFLRPTGSMAPAASWESLRASNAKILRWLEAATDLRQRCLPGLPAALLSNGRYDRMDGYQWILGAATHLVRHTSQILEIRALPAFPED